MFQQRFGTFRAQVTLFSNIFSTAASRTHNSVSAKKDMNVLTQCTATAAITVSNFSSSHSTPPSLCLNAHRALRIFYE
jgi:hypothetical protein